jgi:hypothetical protein
VIFKITAEEKRLILKKRKALSENLTVPDINVQIPADKKEYHINRIKKQKGTQIIDPENRSTTYMIFRVRPAEFMMEHVTIGSKKLCKFFGFGKLWILKV